MLKPSDIDKKEYRRGIGYSKKDVDRFREEVFQSYNILYNENMELKEKLAVLNDGLQYYKTIEKTLQKALILAQKTADENHAEALKRARAIEMDARVRADKILSDAKKELGTFKARATELVVKFDTFKSQYKALAQSQMDMLESDAYNLRMNEINESFVDLLQGEDVDVPTYENGEYTSYDIEGEEKIVDDIMDSSYTPKDKEVHIEKEVKKAVVKEILLPNEEVQEKKKFSKLSSTLSFLLKKENRSEESKEEKEVEEIKPEIPTHQKVSSHFETPKSTQSQYSGISEEQSEVTETSNILQTETVEPEKVQEAIEQAFAQAKSSQSEKFNYESTIDESEEDEVDSDSLFDDSIFEEETESEEEEKPAPTKEELKAEAKKELKEEMGVSHMKELNPFNYDNSAFDQQKSYKKNISKKFDPDKSDIFLDESDFGSYEPLYLTDDNKRK